MTPGRRCSTMSVIAFVATLLGMSVAPASARSEIPETVWLCRPGMADNPCEPGLDTTLYTALGEVTDITPVGRDQRVDCFYVYPTVSDQPTPQANFDIDPELRSIALYQAARYSSECRVFAPVYRQITLNAILGGGGVTPEMRETAYQDVRRAWLDYLEHDNQGRGVVFIGHSQGTGVLRRLLQEEIDPDPAVRDKLVSALLLGGNVTVAKGSDRGGDFQNIPACRSRDQLGCVVSFVTFNGPVPPDSRFGRTSDANLEVLCTNPASLAGGLGKADAIYPSEPFAPGTIIGAGISLLDAPPITATTPWAEYRGAYRAKCSSDGGANVLQVEERGRTPVLTPVPDPTWGLHLVDANVALGDLVDLVDHQAVRWQRRQRRYLNEVFSSVTVTPDIQYGAAPDEDGRTERLLLDLYQPVGDSQARRPAIVWVHGGGFSAGNRSAEADNAASFAKRGYVTVSISYRLRNGDIGTAINDAQHDAQAAVRWLRRYADQYRIDPDRIAIGGTSAGAITALYVGNHAADPGTSGNPGFRSDVRAAISISGFGGHYSRGDAPAVLFHGTNDSVIDYQNAVTTCQRHRQGGNTCELHTYQGAGHGLYPTYRTDIQRRTSEFLHRHLGLP